MIKDILNNLIMESMKAHNSVRTETYRAIKTAFMNWQTAKENAGKEITKTDEINVLKKMVKQRQESMEQYFAAKRDDLAYAEADQITIIKEFLPEEATEEDITRVFLQVKDVNNLEPVKKNMGIFIKEIKNALPSADGKLVAQIVSKNLA
jgi:uncharacterized protein YqeY